MISPLRRCAARIALFAVLFAAISPALAALRFYGDAEILANILSVHSAEHSQHQHSGHAGSKSSAVYCAFCLDMASVQALTLAAPHLLHARATEIPQCAVERSATPAPVYFPQHSRAPPVFFL
ncbi:MAG: DUF2946 family protein [Burkholderiales bacterium]